MASRSAETIAGLPALGTQQWDDFYFRDNFDDTGRYPAGVVSASPDIVPLGPDPVSDPQYLIDGVNWATDFGGSTFASEPNYIYLRGQNLSSSHGSGRLYLYQSRASLLLWPSDPGGGTGGWANRPLRTSRGDSWLDVSAGPHERFCGPEPFQWIAEPGSREQYALIARIVTERHPNPIPAPGSITDFAAYISQHPDMAWRNVVTIDPRAPVTTSTVSYRQGAQAAEVYLQLSCEFVPDGSAVSFSSGTPGPIPVIRKNKTTVRNEVDPAEGIPRFMTVLRTRIPADWASNISFTWYSEGKVPVPGMCLRLDVIMPVAGDHPVLGAVSAPLSDFGIDSNEFTLAPRRGIRLGSATMCTPRSAVT